MVDRFCCYFHSDKDASRRTREGSIRKNHVWLNRYWDSSFCLFMVFVVNFSSISQSLVLTKRLDGFVKKKEDVKLKSQYFLKSLEILYSCSIL